MRKLLFRGGPTAAKAGIVKLSDNGGTITAIKKIVRHPSYKPPAMYADIAVLQLDKSLQFGKEIRPACLHQRFDNVPVKAIASGWGVTEFGLYIFSIQYY